MELEISRYFTSELENFFPLFLSCNEPTNYMDWCCKCDKCIFIGLIMSAFLSPVQVVSIFKQNLFDNIKLLQKYKILIGKHNTITMKPFECVGTIDEARAATHLTFLRHIEHIIKFEKNDNDNDTYNYKTSNNRIMQLRKFCIENKIDNLMLPTCLYEISKDLNLIDNYNNANLEMLLHDDEIVKLYLC